MDDAGRKPVKNGGRRAVRATLKAGTALSLFAASILPAWADEAAWETRYQTDVAATFTDNVLVSPVDEESDLVLSFTGGVTAHAETRGGLVDFSYQFSWDQYVNEDDLSGVRHSLNTRNDLVVVPDLLFVGIDGFIGQRSAASSLSQPGTRRTGGANQTLQIGGSVRPRLVYEIANRAQLTLGAIGSFVLRRNPDVGGLFGFEDDQYSWGANASLANMQDDSRIDWRLSASARRNDNSLENDNAEAYLKIKLVEGLRLIARGGHDWINGREQIVEPVLPPLPATPIVLGHDIDHSYLRGGLEMQPYDNFRLLIEAGERYGDESYFGELDYDVASYFRVRGRYSEEFTTDQQQQLLNYQLFQPIEVTVPTPGMIAIYDENTNALYDPRSPYFDLILDQDLIDSSYFLESSSLSAGGEIARTMWNVSWTRQRREIDSLPVDPGLYPPEGFFEDTNESVSITVSRSFGRRTLVSLQAVSRDETSNLPVIGSGPFAVDLGREIDSKQLNLSYSHSFSPAATLSATFVHTEREDQNGLSVTENALMFYLAQTW